MIVYHNLTRSPLPTEIVQDIPAARNPLNAHLRKRPSSLAFVAVEYPGGKA